MSEAGGHAVAGVFFSGSGSRRLPATLTLAEGAFTVQGDAGVLAGPLPQAQVTVSSRLGRTPRFLRFPDGGCFETADNDAIDRLLTPLRPAHDLAHRLESRLRYVALGLLVTVAVVWGGVRYGIPALAQTVAYALPPAVDRQIGDGALELLDAQLLGPSTLDAAEQARLQAVFAPLLAPVSTPARPVTVVFRAGRHGLGANALALPSGTIVFTDQLVRLAVRDEELLAVLAHEIGHVEGRHALRQVLQASALGLVVTAVTGDVSSVSSLVTAIPVLLTQLGYSRSFEFEADRYAVRTLATQGIPAAHFGAMLSRLDRDPDCKPEADCAASESGWQDYLSTHPATEERLRALGLR